MSGALIATENNRVACVDAMPDMDHDDLGLEWALSEFRGTYRQAKMVSATFTLNDDAELSRFLVAVERLFGAESLGEHENDMNRRVTTAFFPRSPKTM